MIWELKKTEKAAPLFEGWQETMIWSCLQGVMGKIYADSRENPVSAVAALGDFRFFAGKPDRELILAGDLIKSAGLWQIPPEFLILVPGNQGWAELIEECLGEKAQRTARYAIKKEPDVFDREKLRKIADRLPAGYELRPIEEELFERCGKIAWCKSWVEQYADYSAYRKFGLGVAILKDGEPVSGASSYTGYIGGIEVQIDTREDYRRKGFALVCGAGLILECLKRGWYPSWDAQNRWSVSLAEKLGYHFEREYTVYVVRREHMEPSVKDDMAGGLR